MPNFQNGKIYKIVDNTNTYDDYYGSTTQLLRKRKTEHISDCKNKKFKCQSHKIIELGNWEMILVENYPCENRKQLHEREKYYITNFPCINYVIPNQTIKEYNLKNRDKILQQNRDYNAKHKDKKKEWREKNREHTQQLLKKHYQLNKDKYAKSDKKWTQANPERRKQINRESYYSRYYWDYINKISLDIFNV